MQGDNITISSASKDKLNEKSKKRDAKKDKTALSKIFERLQPFIKRNFSPSMRPQWFLFLVTAILAWYTYKLFKSTSNQFELVKNSQAANLQIMLRNSIESAFGAETVFKDVRKTTIVNTGIVAAKNIKINFRANLLEKDFEHDQVDYSREPRIYPILTNLGEISFIDTIDVKLKKGQRVYENLWPYWHITFSYDNGFGDRITVERGFYDFKNGEEGQCKHNATK